MTTLTPQSSQSSFLNSLAKLDALPAMPLIAKKLLVLDTDTEKGETDLINLVGQDPQIVAKLLSMANSPSLRTNRKISSVSEAVMVIGLTQVKSVALGIAAMSSFKCVKPCRYFSPQNLYLHSLAMAISMIEIANYMPHSIRPPRDQIYLAGLLHDIGYMAIHHINSEASEELHHCIVLNPKEPVLLVDMDKVGITHCEIGAQLARQWHLPEEVVNVIGRHHDPRIELLTSANCLPTLARLTEKMLADYGMDENTPKEITEQEWRALRIDIGRRDEIMNLVNEIVVQIAQVS